MINLESLETHWNDIQDKIRRRWSQLTDDDLPQFHGEIDHLIAVIERKTGEGRKVIERYLGDLSGAVGSSMNRTVASARLLSHGSSGTLYDAMHQAKNQVRAGYIETERFVRDRPREALAISFGAGIFVGVTIGLMMKSR